MQGVVTCCIVSCLLLTACALRKAPEISQKKSEGQKLTSDLSVFKAFHGQERAMKDQQKIVHEGYFEARMVDIPIPLGSSPLQDAADADAWVFETLLATDELLFFYQRELERLGWQEQVIFKGTESLVIYKKPSRWLAISMQPQQSWWPNEDKIKVTIHQQSIKKAT